MQPGRPVYAAVPEKPLILGHHEGLLENRGDIVQRPIVVNIPSIPVGYRQRNVVAINDLHLAQPGGFLGKRLRQRQKIGVGFP